jgi:ATP-dependent DNA helicase PIF1
MQEEDTQLFCFESQKWNSIFSKENHVVLKTVFRQNDETYKKILNQIRIGELDEEGKQLLNSCVGKEINLLDVPTKIYAIRAKTDFVNANMYAKINKPEYVFDFETKTNLTTYLETGKAIDLPMIEYCRKIGTEIMDNEAISLIHSSNRPVRLKLKEGAKVMCLHNIDLSRDICTGSQGIVIKFVGEHNFPVVKFHNGVEIVMEPIWIQSEDIPSVAVSQIPLCLAWALTIHKIQGATLTSAEMDLGNSVFEYGQTYVALSRIKSIDGLYLSAFNPHKIKANPVVKDFYTKISEYICSEEKTEKNGKKNSIFSDFEYKELESEIYNDNNNDNNNVKKIKINYSR